MAEEPILIVSVSGVRGILGRGLTADVAGNFAAALATHVKGGAVVVSSDGRAGGHVLRHAVLAGLSGGGCPVHDIGVAPTPTAGLAIRRFHAAGGIQITASHNPAQWNGLKLFGADGRVMPGDQGKRVQECYELRDFRYCQWDGVGNVVANDDMLGWHASRVLELIDANAVRSKQFNVFVDANGGAGGPLSLHLLASLGCKVHALHCHADGVFRHTPEPIAKNLTDIGAQVQASDAAVGFVLDPDADRLALLDESGRFVGEELTLALSVQYRLSQERGPVVINMSTSRLTETICQSFDVPCYRSAVGEANVADMMLEKSAVIGGEGNGGVMDPRVGLVRDPFIGMGLILNLMADSGKRLSEMVDALPSCEIVKTSCRIDRQRLPTLLKKLEKHWSHAAPNRLDGLRLAWDECWLHVRPSNTEPIVRIIAEAANETDAAAICEEARGVLNSKD